LLIQEGVLENLTQIQENWNERFVVLEKDEQVSVTAFPNMPGQDIGKRVIEFDNFLRPDHRIAFLGTEGEGICSGNVEVLPDDVLFHVINQFEEMKFANDFASNSCFS